MAVKKKRFTNIKILFPVTTLMAGSKTLHLLTLDELDMPVLNLVIIWELRYINKS